MSTEQHKFGWLTGEFIDKALEHEFRDASFDNTIPRARTFYWAIILVTLVILFIAWQRFQLTAEFFEVATIRVFVGALAIVLLVQSYRTRSWMLTDNLAAFLYLCLLGLTIMWGIQIDSTPAALIARNLIIVFIGYLIRPTKMKFLLGIGIAITIVMSFQVIAMSDVSVPETTVAISAGIIVNMAGYYVGRDNAQNLRTNFILQRQAKSLTAEAQEAKALAEKANKAKSDFLSSMSHELRTPLNSVLGFSQILIEDTEQPLSEDQKESVDHIRQAGSHLLTLVDEVLDLSKVESGDLGLSIEDVALRPLLEECSDLISRQAADASVAIEIEPSADIYVLADSKRLKQVILNLMSNAVKYNQPEGQVQLSASLSSNQMASISVSDTGLGIPEDRVKDLFQPFNRLGYENSAIEGTGVGLVITKKLVEAMDGSVEVKSDPGKGSNFTVYFPVSAEAEG